MIDCIAAPQNWAFNFSQGSYIPSFGRLSKGLNEMSKYNVVVGLVLLAAGIAVYFGTQSKEKPQGQVASTTEVVPGQANAPEAKPLENIPVVDIVERHDLSRVYEEKPNEQSALPTPESFNELYQNKPQMPPADRSPFSPETKVSRAQ
jgi:hypothetical protein